MVIRFSSVSRNKRLLFVAFYLEISLLKLDSIFGLIFCLSHEYDLSASLDTPLYNYVDDSHLMYNSTPHF